MSDSPLFVLSVQFPVSSELHPSYSDSTRGQLFVHSLYTAIVPIYQSARNVQIFSRGRVYKPLLSEKMSF